jgi:hypothetical protein
MRHTIHTPVLRGKPIPKVNALEAVGLTDPPPYIRALFQQTAKENKEEASAPKPNVGNADALRKKILAMSLFPSIYSK